MDLIFKDSEKIKIYSDLQRSLCELEPNCSDKDINKVIEQIPKSYLAEKENLLHICKIFAYYNRNNLKTIRGNGIKLFEKIMAPIKTHLRDQSVFFWNIFGALNFFKQWFYEEGLIDIDVIIQSALNDNSYIIAEYFLPEIKEKDPEIFDKQIKKNIKIYSDDYITEFKELRKKLFKWLRESNDFQDSFYGEIEKNSLRLAIKRDDINQFQTIISNSNISINSKIKESNIEQSYINATEETLIDYSIGYNSMKIFKYLILNDATFSIQGCFNSICCRNYEIFHQVESKNEEYFNESLLDDSILSWNFEISKYSIENYGFEFIENENIESDKDIKILEIIKNICYSSNFEFFEKIFLPFLRKNPRFVKENIHEILFQTLYDQSLFFTKEFLKFEGIDINYHSKIENDKSLLVKAIQLKNANAVELLLNNQNIDIENTCNGYLPFNFVCGYSSYLKIFQLFLNHPKFNIYSKDLKFNFSSLTYCMIKGSFYGIKCILDKYPDYNEEISVNLIGLCFSKNYLLAAKLMLKYYIKKNDRIPIEFFNDKEYADDFFKIIDELYDYDN